MSRILDDFLLTAANLDCIRDKAADGNNPAEAIAEFDRYLTLNNHHFTEQMKETWQAIASVVLS